MRPMPRLARRDHVLPGLPHFISVRGNGGRRLFSYSRDYDQMVRYVGEAFARHGVALHQLTVLCDQVLLIATPPTQTALSEAMKSCLQRYGAAHNRRRHTSGRIFEQRYRSDALPDEAIGDAILTADAAAPPRHPWTTAHLHCGEPELGRVPVAAWTPHRWFLTLGLDAAPRYRALLDFYVTERWLSEPPARDR